MEAYMKVLLDDLMPGKDFSEAFGRVVWSDTNSLPSLSQDKFNPNSPVTPTYARDVQVLVDKRVQADNKILGDITPELKPAQHIYNVARLDIQNVDYYMRALTNLLQYVASQDQHKINAYNQFIAIENEFLGACTSKSVENLPNLTKFVEQQKELINEICDEPDYVRKVCNTLHQYACTNLDLLVQKYNLVIACEKDMGKLSEKTDANISKTLKDHEIKQPSNLSDVDIVCLNKFLKDYISFTHVSKVEEKKAPVVVASSSYKREASSRNSSRSGVVTAPASRRRDPKYNGGMGMYGQQHQSPFGNPGYGQSPFGQSPFGQSPFSKSMFDHPQSPSPSIFSTPKIVEATPSSASPVLASPENIFDSKATESKSRFDQEGLTLGSCKRGITQATRNVEVLRKKLAKDVANAKKDVAKALKNCDMFIVARNARKMSDSKYSLARLSKKTSKTAKKSSISIKSVRVKTK